jgi:hypothetical protein
LAGAALGGAATVFVDGPPPAKTGKPPQHAATSRTGSARVAVRDRTWRNVRIWLKMIHCRDGKACRETSQVKESARRAPKILRSLVGRRCCAAQEFRAERQLCPAKKVEILVLHPNPQFATVKGCIDLPVGV